MNIVIALIGLALVVIVAAFVAQPLVVRPRARATVPVEEAPREKLLAERDALYATIRDLDFDFQTGKLLEQDYRSMRETYAARGVEILKQLDAMGMTGGQTDEIEAAVRARRSGPARTVRPSAAEDEIEAAVRARRQAAARNPQSESRGLVCPSCGRPIDPTDRFCARCGAALTVEATR